MIASSNSTSVRWSSLLSLSEAAEKFGVHFQTLRNWHNSGKIRAFRTPGGHRRFCPKSIATAMGLAVDDAEKKVSVAIYARVSSQSQDQKGSLDKQIERMKELVSEREGLSKNELMIYSDVASAFGTRNGLNQLVDGILMGEVMRVYVEYQDRLSRVPALTRLLEHLCKGKGVEIIAVDREEKDASELQSGMMELIEYVTVISNRISGAKGGKQTQVEMPPEILKEAYELKKAGLSIREIGRRFIAKGYKDQRGHSFKRSLLGNRLMTNWQMLERMYGGDQQRQNSFEKFVEGQIVRVRSNKISITRKAIQDAYREYCNKHGLLEVSNGTITKTADKLGWNKEIFNVRSVKYLGLSLVTKEKASRGC